MKIVDEVKFTLGIIDILAGILIIVLCVHKHKGGVENERQ